MPVSWLPLVEFAVCSFGNGSFDGAPLQVGRFSYLPYLSSRDEGGVKWGKQALGIRMIRACGSEFQACGLKV